MKPNWPQPQLARAPVETNAPARKRLDANDHQSDEEDEEDEEETESSRSPSPPPAKEPKIPAAIKRKLEEDDAEIAELEKKLGIKGKKKLPKAFEEDGLDELLGGLAGDYDELEVDEKPGKKEADEWLAEKRRKAQNLQKKKIQASREIEDEDEDEDDHSGSESESDESGDDDFGIDGFDGSSFEGFDDEEEPTPQKPPRENPYMAPVANTEPSTAKYIPPSMRKAAGGSEDLTRLRRQLQGLINRLTETNLVQILQDVERLYSSNARQHVTSSLIDVLLAAVHLPNDLPDTLMILYSGFISAIYKVIGTDFGAHILEQIVLLYNEHYARVSGEGNETLGMPTIDTSKESSNLITLLSNMYNFQVIGCNIVFDLMRSLLETLSELNAELLLRVVRTSGPQLRQDDPSALKDAVSILRSAVAKVGEDKVSTRNKVMIDTITDLKNNKVKTVGTGSAINLEHTIRMKKILGSLNNRSIKASEPLCIGLKDITESDKRGKWWLVGASWAGREEAETETNKNDEVKGDQPRKKVAVVDAESADILQIARDQRMNTDIRRAIFVTILSASDYQDACQRLRSLKLKRVQELEIPKVLLHCSGAEQMYNPYYTLIAKRLCGEKRIRMAFQFSLWDLFKKMGETYDEEDAGDNEGGEGPMESRQIINLAKLYASLVLEGGLSLTILKPLNLSFLQPTTKMFVELLLVTVLLESQGEKGGDKGVQGLFEKVKGMPSLETGLQFFLRKVVRKTDLVEKKEKVKVEKACKVAVAFLVGSMLEDA